MSIVRINRKIVANVLRSCRTFSTAVQDTEEYTIVPEYPPILDLSHEKRLERKKEAIWEGVKVVKTVEEKQIKLNMPKYYGFKCYMFTESIIGYNVLPLAQHITRTHLLETTNLPEYYNKINVDSLINDVRNDVEEAILIESSDYRKENEVKHDEIQLENIISASICKHLHRCLFSNTSRICQYLNQTQFDFEPRIESFWFAGGMNPPENIKRHRRSIEWIKHTENEPTNRAIQYIGTPMAVLRSELPLLPIIPYSESENPSFEVPFFQYDPRVVGTQTDYRHVTNIPGFWPGDVHRFGLISYHNRGHLLSRTYNDPSDHKEALHCQGILASFGWLNAQANFLGFTTYNDITYPLVTQTVVTNGRIWSFFVYQLNTLLVHSKHVRENPKRNICWALPELKLYEEVKDGKVIGFNDDVLKILLKFYANVPEERLGVNLTPYLSQNEKVIADYEDDDKRNWLEREYKFLMANRPRVKLQYEVYHWEKIYKIDHQTRPMDARRRPFELGIQPFNRTLDDRQPVYIPRKHRPHLPRNKGRYAKEYFP